MSFTHDLFNIALTTEKPFEQLAVSNGELNVASIAYGFSLGFAYHTTWTAIIETRRISRFTTYIILLWLEIVANVIYATVVWVHIVGKIPPSVGFFVGVALLWIIQVQCVAFILVNRLCIMVPIQSHKIILQAVVVGLMAVTSISAACIWVPAQLQTSSRIISMNHWWNILEKVIYLVIDLCLYTFFIWVMRSRLLRHGLKKYDKVLTYNMLILSAAIGMDILLVIRAAIDVNPFVSAQLYPITYIIKLQVVISISRFIVNVARGTGLTVNDINSQDTHTQSTGTGVQRTHPTSIAIHINTDVHRNDEDHGNLPSKAAFKE